MAKARFSSIEKLRELFDYNSVTGEFTHRPRPLSMFSGTWRHTAEHGWRRWNTKFAGKKAGHTSKDNGYVRLSACGENFYAHHAAWAYVHGYWAENEIDHINHDPSDNRIENLREATSSQQKQNRRAGRFNKALPKGVSWIERLGKYRAYLGKKYIGVYWTVEEARASYEKAALEAYGEFSKLD